MITACNASLNLDFGIATNASTIANCTANPNGGGILSLDGSVTGSIANNNNTDGIRADNAVIAFCKAGGNNPGNNPTFSNIRETGASRTGNLPAP